MLWLFGFLSALLCVTANVGGFAYWPVLSPSPSIPWVVGEKNILAWKTAAGLGIETFDVQLHNVDKKVMDGFIKLALRVPHAAAGKYGTYGGELEVDLTEDVPTGDKFVVIFTESMHGQVYAKSEPFSIFKAGEQPGNYSSNPDKVPEPKTTATLTEGPVPTQEWAITLSGKPKVYSTEMDAAEKAKETATSLI
ncbi:hypothetical protein A1Q2_08078 [Trichosporon asahii var. asahii CBS 8904]|uniref:Uncharacterized protein n=2 Tax=Trichosporon asahii var. asahii TaxID=189963 RepID=K1V144_TRIAC|nr:hypothetical protein A1Q1_02043 [Trichosporon asahii var. asahii CBS 2479]EJT48874.1 hypothetical protein A1Q1_02043 [Trichosporon asahii var. asahii CBS 2479]EKC97619.1 hypothetical protein A1Q2_08078 [Trichosporon asahii var. asahii CBS 8904]